MQNKTAERNFFLFLLVAVLALSAIIFFPFLTVLVLGVSFAIVLQPIDEWIKRKLVKNSIISALITILLFIIFLIVPLVTVGSLVFNEVKTVLSTDVASSPFIQSIESSINNILPASMGINGQDLVHQAVGYIEKNIGNLFTETLTIIFSFFLMILSIFYFLKNGHEWKQSLIKFLPTQDKNDALMLDRLKETISGVIKGYIFIGILQGILMGIGLTIFGVPNAALWGLVAGIASLIPTVGTALVSVPIILMLLSTGQTTAAIGMAIWAGVLVGMVDNIVTPFIVGKKTRVSAFFILFSVLGGIALMGPVGILLGPIVMSLLYSLLSVYHSVFNTTQKQSE